MSQRPRDMGTRHSQIQEMFCSRKRSSGLQDKFGGHLETAAAT
jgi:hypothetical protein